MAAHPKVKRVKLYDGYSPEGLVCIVTGERGEWHHLSSRGARGPDLPWNLMPLSRAKHTEAHTLGLVEFAKRHRVVTQWLKQHGWSLCPFKKKWVQED